MFQARSYGSRSPPAAFSRRIYRDSSGDFHIRIGQFFDRLGIVAIYHCFDVSTPAEQLQAGSQPVGAQYEVGRANDGVDNDQPTIQLFVEEIV